MSFIPGTIFGSVLATTTKNQKITLLEQSLRPLSPAATVAKTGTSVKVSCIIYITSKNNPPSNSLTFKISALVTDNNQLSLYVSSPFAFKKDTKFYPYLVNIEFSTDSKTIPNITDLNRVKVIAWDADPRGSRGTIIDVD